MSTLKTVSELGRTLRRSSIFLLGATCLLGATLAGCESTAVVGKVVEGPSSVAMITDAKDERFAGPGIGGAEAELRAVRDGLGDRLISKQTTSASGEFHIGTVDRLTSETLFLIVSKAGYITAKGPVSIAADGKKSLVVLKRTSK